MGVRIGGLRVDFLIRSAALVIEYDGAGHDQIKDAARDARLRTLRYNVIRITKHDLRNPAQIRRRIERYLAVAAR
jgi:very-short-patch-repair endonuclease